MLHSRDIGQIVRKWQIRVSGAMRQSIDVFLTRLEDCRALANLSEKEVLSKLPELFTDTAATWCRNEKDVDHVAGFPHHSETVVWNHQKVPAADSGRSL